jgi:hypothetical protein
MNPDKLKETGDAPSRRRVLFFNDIGFQYGAGIAQARQIQSMLELGWEVGAIAWETDGINLEQIVAKPVEKDLWLGLRRMSHLGRGGSNSDNDIISGMLMEVARFNPEIVVIGNLHSPQWPLQLLTSLGKLGCRVVAYMHDCYLVTGRCAYPESCNLYLVGCNESCPTATEYPPLGPELIAGQWRLRRDIFNRTSKVEIVANSHWTKSMLTSALPAFQSGETVYLGADENVFRPGDKKAARQHLGLPKNKPIVLCAAVSFKDRRKGSHYLKEIVAALNDSVTFAAFGHHAGDIPNLIGLGYHLDPRELAMIYQAANLFIGTATAEAFGQTIMEAQLCGLPVVAFQVGGVSEIVRNEITGKLVPTGDITAMIAAIKSILGDAHFLAHSGIWARQTSANRFSLKAQALGWSSYIEGKLPRGTGRNPPSIFYVHTPGSRDEHLPHRPSWPGAEMYISEEHSRIFDLTSALPGWQMPGDSEKLYEMGYHAGDVILEIGTYGGRSATVELKGALANPARTLPPQFYGIDIAPDSIARTRQTLADHKLIDYCHLFEGTFQAFTARWEIEPTMVFLDGDHRYEGVAADMAALSKYLKPGTPVLVHDFLNPENDTGAYGVRRAGYEWEATGAVRLIGCFGCTALYLTQPAPDKA